MDSIFDIDDDESALPAWARKKLEISQNSATRGSWSTTTTTATETISSIEGLAFQQTSKSGRAVWGACLNTSLIAIDSELSSLASTTTTSYIEVTPENPTELTPKTSLKNFENCIQFPSPCVNKDSYQVKQVASQPQQAALLKACGRQQRPSWICSNNEDDLIFNLHRLSTEEDVSSSDELDTPSSSNSGDSSVKIEVEEELVAKAETGDSLLSPCTPTSRRVLATKSCFSMAENVIKLECDMENSLRRQSISARYLLRTAQQKEMNEAEKKKLVPLNLIEALKETEEAVGGVQELKREVKETAAVVAPVIPVVGDFRGKAASKTTRCSVGGNFQLLYSHHTESSLNKAKPKQSQQFHSSKANIKFLYFLVSPLLLKKTFLN